jgi:hypothetical protein
MSVLPDGVKVFDFTDSKYVTSLGHFEFFGDKHWLFVHADGPKVFFPLLHRTDFRHMFLSLEKQDQDHVRKLVSSNEIWNQLGIKDPATCYLFPFPYRAEMEAVDAETRLATTLLSVRDEITAKATADKWRLAEHGPDVREWWLIVINGDQRRGGLAKDVASPPPRHRGGRDRRAPDVPGFRKADGYAFDTP